MRKPWLLLSFLLLPAALSVMPGAPRSGAHAEANTKLAPPAPPEGPAPFDPTSIRLDPNSPEQRMLEALAVPDAPRAQQIGAAALANATAVARGRLLWLLARAHRDDASEDATDAHLTALKDGDHPLARWAKLKLAERWLQRRPTEALAIAKSIDTGWAGAGRARVLVALAHFRAGDRAVAEPLLRGLLDKQRDQAAAANLALPLAEILSLRNDRNSLREALALCRRVSARGVGTDAALQADGLAAQLLARLPAKDRYALAHPSPEDELARGQALMNARMYPEAQAVLEKLAARLKRDRDPTLRCKAELEAGRALFQQRQRTHREQAAKRLSGVARRCKEPEVKAWARYYAASARQRSADPAGAIAEYETLARELPEHSLADDALYLQAFAKKDAGDQAGMRQSLERLLERYPRGDMRSDARFALAFEARSRGEHDAALQHLEKLLADGPIENAEGLEGRTAYWRARTLQSLHRNDEAKAAYLDIARGKPLSYHAQQALVRLREIDPAAADALIGELSPGASAPTRLVFPWRVELETPSFRSALELLRVGEGELARQDLGWLGATGEGADNDMLWLVASLLHEAGAYAEASQLVRSRLRSFRETAPSGRARLLWRIAYPRAYEPLIEQAANEHQVPPEFVRAVAREESSFNPEAVSAALAYGLIQLIRPTARMHAQALGLPSDPAALKRPEINLRIGSHFIQELWRRYRTNPAVVPAAYNAGYVAADRWLRDAATQPLDEWIERIPYRETKRYTRRVLQSYGIYAFLDTGKLPPLPVTLPSPPP